MTSDPRFDILFEPIKLGPVTAPNRFYQVPHCTGMGNGLPQTLVSMREIKAEGGWGVVNTEYCSIDPSADDMPAPFCSLWDDGDQKNLARMAEAVHRHGSLAGMELWHGGYRSSNLQTREISRGPVSMPASASPWQSSVMDKEDIRNYRRWHRNAALRSKEAGFDIIYVYAAHTYLIAQFMDAQINRRTDEYGGSAENRSRLLRELLADTRDAVGDRCAVVVRIEVHDERGEGQAERSDLIASLAPMVDLFDVLIADYTYEIGPSRFVKEAALEDQISHVRKITGKPVVCVGRFTSPETMLSQVKRGVVDLIGAARPSIADPFLPAKIRDGRLDDIRECIGCNICYAMDGLGVAIRCTQNPTMGEEWRRGWHPERVNVSKSREKVLIVGGGPAGLEAALTLAKRGHEVNLADANRELGGRLLWETKLPGFSEWMRVRDWRQHQLSKLSNAELFRESPMDAASIAEFGADHVVVATGCAWRTDGRGRSSVKPIPSYQDARTVSPEAVVAGAALTGPVVVFDEDYYYVGSAIAEFAAKQGHTVIYVTSEGTASAWSSYTVDQGHVYRRLAELNVQVITNHSVVALTTGGAELRCVFTGKPLHVECGAFIPVTSREPDESLWRQVVDLSLPSLHRIGDCRAPGIIAQAVHSGHRLGRELGVGAESAKRDRVVMA